MNDKRRESQNIYRTSGNCSTCKRIGISGHIALAQTNSGIDTRQSNSATGTCETAGDAGPITSSCTATQTNTHSNSGGVH